LDGRRANRNGRKSNHLYRPFFWGPLGDPTIPDTELWIANYGVVVPQIPNNDWANATLWQYTDTGSVPGIAHNVDRDRFFGSTSQLRIFADVPEPATWAMLLFGFFGVGFTVRSARRKNSVAVA
jgi:hypothetical protein